MTSPMPRKKLGLIHTSSTLIAVFDELCHELLPHVDVFNVTDDSLIQEVIAVGSVQENVSQRLCTHVQQAESAGADVVMVTCSSIGGTVEAAQALATVPVLRVDQAMADRAVVIARRIGVVATVHTTLVPTVELIKQRAEVAGKSVEVTARLCDGAFAELMQGNVAEHDRMVREALVELVQSVDAIVLAQASMARIVSQLSPETTSKPILSSPRMAIESLIPRFVEESKSRT